MAVNLKFPEQGRAHTLVYIYKAVEFDCLYSYNTRNMRLTAKPKKSWESAHLRK